MKMPPETQQKIAPADEITIKVSEGQFRSNLKMMFDMVREGANIHILQGGDSFHRVKDEEEYEVASPEFLEKLARAREELKAGRFVEFNTAEELQEWIANHERRV